MPSTHRAATAAVLACLGSGCTSASESQQPSAERAPAVADAPRCRSAPVDNYLAEYWQKCWFDATRGRWRTLSHEFHYNVLVVEVEAASLDDAEEIIRRFVDLHRGRFIDITLYIHQEPASRPGPVRRIHWDIDSDGLDTLNFTGTRGQ